MNRFLLTLHTKKILSGRGLYLMCSAPICLHQPKMSPDPLYGREIEVQGYGVCPRCGHKTLIENFLFNEKARKAIPKCEKCGSKNLKVIYTQYVISKHRKTNHYYYHEECYDKMFIRADQKLPYTKKKYRTRYGGSRGKGVVVTLPFDPRKGVCSACGKSKAKGEIKVTCLHHWKYAYKPSTVAKNPILVLENTSEFCFACHMVGDGFRSLMKLSPERVMKVANTMTKELKERFIVICNFYLEMIKNAKKKI